MLHEIFTLLGALAVAVGAVGVCAHVADSSRQSILVAGALAPFLMLAAVPGAVVCAALGQWAGLIAGVAVTGAALATQFPLYRKRFAPRSPANFALMQANILIGSADPDAVVEQVRARGVDVLTVVELTPESEVALAAAGLDTLLPYSFTSAAPSGHGTGIWSKHPIRDEQRHDGFTTELLSVRVIASENVAPLVFAVHPVPPWPRNPADWVREMKLLRQLLAKMPADDGPVLVSGDFNATYDHKAFRSLLGARYRDAAVAVGAGIQPTYSADKWYPPVIAIDHILVSSSPAVAVDVVGVESVRLPGSDHLGLCARLHLTSAAGDYGTPTGYSPG